MDCFGRCPTTGGPAVPFVPQPEKADLKSGSFDIHYDWFERAYSRLPCVCHACRFREDVEGEEWQRQGAGIWRNDGSD